MISRTRLSRASSDRGRNCVKYPLLRKKLRLLGTRELLKLLVIFIGVVFAIFDERVRDRLFRWLFMM